MFSQNLEQNLFCKLKHLFFILKTMKHKVCYSDLTRLFIFIKLLTKLFMSLLYYMKFYYNVPLKFILWMFWGMSLSLLNNASFQCWFCSHLHNAASVEGVCLFLSFMFNFCPQQHPGTNSSVTHFPLTSPRLLFKQCLYYISAY